MYEHNSNKLVVNYSNGHIPQGSECWPVIDMSHLKGRSLESLCTEKINSDMLDLNKLNNLNDKIK
jgi:hypothetical protein